MKKVEKKNIPTSTQFFLLTLYPYINKNEVKKMRFFLNSETFSKVML